MKINLHYFILFLLSMICPLKAAEEESLLVRRILQFLEERHIQLVQAQIVDFLKQYPESDSRDNLLVIYGDIDWESGRYEDALTVYDLVQSDHYRDKIYNNRLDCLYQLRRYEDLQTALLEKGDFHQKDLLSHDELLWLFFHAEAILHQALNQTVADTKIEAAKAHYEKLLDSDHSLNAHLALGEIHIMLGEPEAAAQHYLEASKGIPDREEELILQAAHLRGQQQPDQALLLYEKVRQMEGTKSSQAALAKGVLLFKHEQYDELIDNADELKRTLDENQKFLFDIYLGRSYFNQNRYEGAIETFKPYLQSPYADQESKKIIYLTMVVSYEQLNKPNETVEVAEQFKTEFPDDKAISKVLYVEALALKSLERYEESLALIDRLIDQYPEDENRQSLDFEKGFILFKMHRWQESRDAFVKFIKTHPGSILEYSASSYAAHAAVNVMESNDDETAQLQVAADMERLLAQPSVDANPQKPTYLLLLGKVYVDLKNYSQAHSVIEEYLEKYPGDEDLFQGYLLMATCCKDGAHDLIGFADNGEHLLRMKPDYDDRTNLRLNLFSAYLELSKSEGKQPYLDLAADHLYQVMKEDPNSVKLENKLWLANYYYEKANEGNNDYYIDSLEDKVKLEFVHRALDSYEKAMTKHMKLDRETLYLESDLLKWSHLYGWNGDPKNQIAILERLVKQQKGRPELSWKLRARTQFSLARAYQATGRTTEALELFDYLKSPSQNSDLTVQSGSHLEWARLRLTLLHPEDIKKGNSDVEVILRTLNDLQVKKSLPQEPIHLEAGLEYAVLKSSLEAPEDREDAHKQLLERMKESFSTRDDLWSKDYYASRQMHPEKDFIYHAYMMLLDAHLMTADAKIAAEDGRMGEAEVKYEAAKSTYRTLTKGKLAVSKYLADQAKSSLKEIEKN